MVDLILHHYEASPYSEKIRTLMGFKGLSWSSVIVPPIAPKADLLALTGGYRRAPVLQIGADIYCDSALIAAELDQRFPARALAPNTAGTATPLLDNWADRILFWQVVRYSMGLRADAVPPALIHDREAFWDHKIDLDGLKADVGYHRGQITTVPIVVILGPNGAGKTTLLNSISGVAQATAGKIFFDGKDITGARPEQVVRMGLTHCPEGRQIFQRLTVEENLVAAHIGRMGKSFETLRQEVFDLFPVLKERRNGMASRMSGGQQQMLAIGRALMSEPKLLMLDEPSLGLAPKIIHQIFRIILDLSQTGISILLVEQNVQLALECGDYAYLLNTGRVRLHGPAKEMVDHSDLSEHYLGGASEENLHV